jgi:hypothetical protein
MPAGPCEFSSLKSIPVVTLTPKLPIAPNTVGLPP